MKVRFGRECEYEARAGETILALARRVSFPLAAGCFNGGCGVCKIRLSSGKVYLNGPVSRKEVTPSEEAEGFTLACRAVPETNIEIDCYTRFRRQSAWKTTTELVSLNQHTV